MNLTSIPGLSPKQIAAEVAEMRRAAQDILASRRKRVAFLREVGVLAAKRRKGASRKKILQPAFAK